MKKLAVILLAFVLANQASAETWKPDSFYSLTQIHYPERPLLGAKTTTRIIQKTLEIWYPEIETKNNTFDASPENIQTFLKEVSEQSGVVITHIGLRQNKKALWENLDNSYTDPLQLLQNTSDRKNTHIVLLDVCHTTAVAEKSDLWSKFSDLTFFAARNDQVTYELPLDCRRPVDLRKRYPEATLWIKNNIPDNNENISFFGLIWLKAWLQTPQAPETREDWVQFGETCNQLCKAFAKDHSRLVSDITVR